MDEVLQIALAREATVEPPRPKKPLKDEAQEESD